MCVCVCVCGGVGWGEGGHVTALGGHSWRQIEDFDTIMRPSQQLGQWWDAVLFRPAQSY